MKGIYQIKCRTTGIIYIGGTSVSFHERFTKHKQTLRRNDHDNEWLQTAWNKYGEDDFVFEKIESLPECSIEEIREREKYWLNIYFLKGKEYCFNMSDCVNGGNTAKLPEVRKKISEGVAASYTPELREVRRQQAKSNEKEIRERLATAMGTDKWKKSHLAAVRKLAKNPEWLAKVKAVGMRWAKAVCTDRGEVFESITDASKAVNTCRSNIRRSLADPNKTAVGRKWYRIENNNQYE